MFSFKRMPSWKILLILIIFSGLTEGVGMTALIPIMATISNETKLINNNFPFNILPDAFSYFGIGHNQPIYHVKKFFNTVVLRGGREEILKYLNA